MDKVLRISRLTVQNFMRIRSLDILPGRKCLVLLKGQNTEGKTSAIRALIAALGGKGFDPDQPIRAGTENTIVDVALADDVAERLRGTVSWTPKGRYLTVRQMDAGGMKLPAGQSVIDALFGASGDAGALAFNPLTFIHTDAKNQLALLMQAIGQTKAFEGLQVRRKKFYDERTIVNRQAKEALQRVKDNSNPSPEETLVEHPAADFQTELDQINKQQSEATAYAAKVQNYGRDTDRMIADRLKMQAEVVTLEGRLAELNSAIADVGRTIEERTATYLAARSRSEQALQAVPGTDAIVARIAEVQAHNDRVREQREHVRLQHEYEAFEQQARRLTQGLQTIDAETKNLLTNSDIGRRIPGLTVNNEGEITHRELPISQASGQEALQLSCLIGMVRNPQLRVMCIDEGDRLDEASLQQLKQIATEHDYQVWMTAIYAGNNDEFEHVVELKDGVQVNQPADDTALSPVESTPKTQSGVASAATVNLDDLEL
jgi:hypothetical protein